MDRCIADSNVLEFAKRTKLEDTCQNAVVFNLGHNFFSAPWRRRSKPCKDRPAERNLGASLRKERLARPSRLRQMNECAHIVIGLERWRCAIFGSFRSRLLASFASCRFSDLFVKLRRNASAAFVSRLVGSRRCSTRERTCSWSYLERHRGPMYMLRASLLCRGTSH